MPLRHCIKPLDGFVTIRDERGKTVPIVATIDCSVEISTSQETVTFLITKQLAMEVILGCDFCDYYVEANRQRRRHVEMDNGYIVPIVC